MQTVFVSVLQGDNKILSIIHKTTCVQTQFRVFTTNVLVLQNCITANKIKANLLSFLNQYVNQYCVCIVAYKF